MQHVKVQQITFFPEKITLFLTFWRDIKFNWYNFWLHQNKFYVPRQSDETMMNKSLKYQIQHHTSIQTIQKHLNKTNPTLPNQCRNYSKYTTVTEANRFTLICSWLELKSEVLREVPVGMPNFVHKSPNSHSCRPPLSNFVNNCSWIRTYSSTLKKKNAFPLQHHNTMAACNPI